MGREEEEEEEEEDDNARGCARKIYGQMVYERGASEREKGERVKRRVMAKRKLKGKERRRRGREGEAQRRQRKERRERKKRKYTAKKVRGRCTVPEVWSRKKKKKKESGRFFLFSVSVCSCEQEKPGESRVALLEGDARGRVLLFIVLLPMGWVGLGCGLHQSRQLSAVGQV